MLDTRTLSLNDNLVILMALCAVAGSIPSFQNFICINISFFQSIIQLTMGDIVSADQTFLAHLSNRQYINSGECRVAENFIRALKFHDIDMVSF